MATFSTLCQVISINRCGSEWFGKKIVKSDHLRVVDIKYIVLNCTEVKVMFAVYFVNLINAKLN